MDLRCLNTKPCISKKYVIYYFWHEILPMKASIGWAYSATSFGIMETVFKKADIMMYKNKLHKR